MIPTKSIKAKMEKHKAPIEDMPVDTFRAKLKNTGGTTRGIRLDLPSQSVLLCYYYKSYPCFRKHIPSTKIVLIRDALMRYYNNYAIYMFMTGWSLTLWLRLTDTNRNWKLKWLTSCCILKQKSQHYMNIDLCVIFFLKWI